MPYRNKNQSNFSMKNHFKRDSKIRQDNSYGKDINLGVTIITVTHMDECIDNVFNNFTRQTYRNKELLIFLTNKEMKIDSWIERALAYENIRVFHCSHLTVGACVNYGVELSSFDYIGVFDHDDYYGPKYITDTMDYAAETNAGLIGKRTHYIYFENSKLLALRNPNNEHQYVSMIDGPTMFFKKEIFKKVRFIDGLDAADVIFSRNCRKNRIPIYSTNRFHHVYIRRQSKNQHAWKISDAILLKKYCQPLAIVEDFREYVDV